MNIFNLLKQFPNEESCIKFLKGLRWKERPMYPYFIVVMMRKNWRISQVDTTIA